MQIFLGPAPPMVYYALTYEFSKISIFCCVCGTLPAGLRNLPVSPAGLIQRKDKSKARVWWLYLPVAFAAPVTGHPESGKPALEKNKRQNSE